MIERLSTRNLATIDIAERPAYDRNNVANGILHMGVGAFHRAHQAMYTEAVLNSGDLRWGITGTSLRTRTMHELLAPQDFLYTLCTSSQSENKLQIIGALTNVLNRDHHYEDIISAIASATTKIITLTVTEKGYCLDQHRRLDLQHPDVQHDLQCSDHRRSLAGILCEGLAQRQRLRGGPITIMSCDNLSGNGQATTQMLNDMAELTREVDRNWLDDHVRSPNSMVDRIVPGTTIADIETLQRKQSIDDPGLVRAEPFSQWVIEDSFGTERPAWEIGGAQIVQDVVPFEQAKLRILNATHSALAYLGVLSGYGYIHEALADQNLRVFIDRLVEEEIIPGLHAPEGTDMRQYYSRVIDRFSNSAIPYKTSQVATDGSLKLQQRVYPSIEIHWLKGSEPKRLCFVVAAWLYSLRTPAISHLFSDPYDALIKVADVDELAGYTEQLGRIWANSAFRTRIVTYSGLIQEHGIAAALARIDE